MKFRALAASWVNRQLNRLGYAVVRIDGGRNPPMFADHLGQRLAYEHILIPDAYAPWATDDEFLGLWAQLRDTTLVDIYRSYELYQLVRQVANVPGDILEVGVWRGGTGMILATAARRWKPAARVWLCDTFSGVVKAGKFDPTYSGGEHSDTSRTAVESLAGRLGIDNVTVLPGVFPDDTGPAVASRSVALCHIDVDAYLSAADIISWVSPRVPSSGILVFDDYGFSSCKGITRLLQEHWSDVDWVHLYNLNKHAILVKR